MWAEVILPYNVLALENIPCNPHTFSFTTEWNRLKHHKLEITHWIEQRHTIEGTHVLTSLFSGNQLENSSD